MIRAVCSAWLLSMAVLCPACAGAVAPAPPSPPPASNPAPPPSPPSLAELYEARDYFALRERLEAGPEEPAGAEERFLAAVVAHAFNRPARSNELLLPLLAVELPEARAFEARQLLVSNHFRLFRYGEALAAAEALLASGLQPEEPEDLDDVRNGARIFRALAAAAPQRTVGRSASVLTVEQHETGRRVAVEIEGAERRTERRYLLDSGANLSVLMRSEAEELGLAILPAGIEVGTSTDSKVTADLAVARRLRLGGVELADVVFLVFPDELLSFPEAGIRISGILGFPVFEALGELRFAGGGRIEVPAEVPERRPRNLALEQLHLLVRVGYQGDDVLCALDTGANRTAFYASFYQRYRQQVEAAGERRQVKVGGVGAVQELDAYRLPEMRLELGGAAVTLAGIDVYVAPLAADKGFLDCNLGQDVFDQVEEYTFNFRSMSVILGPVEPAR